MPKEIERDAELCSNSAPRRYEQTEEGRTPCQVYTRVMGYIRPVSGYNPGKRSEFYSRKYFEESKVDNSAFIRKFSK